MFLFYQAWISLLHLPEPRAKGKTVLKVNASKRPILLVRMEPSQLVQHQGEVPRGDAPLTLRSVYGKISRRLVRFSCLLTFIGEFPSMSAMAELYPSMVFGCNFLSWNRYIRKSAIDFTGGALKSPNY